MHLFYVDNNGIKEKDLWFEHLPATKRQQLARQRSGALAGLPDSRFYVFAVLIIR